MLRRSVRNSIALVREVFGEVVALFGCARRVDLVVVGDEVGVVLVGVAAEEAVEALEAAAEGPAVAAGGHVHVGLRREVPLADGVGGVAVRSQDLGEEAVLEGDLAGVAGEAAGELDDAGHGVGVVVAAGQEGGAGGGAEGGGVEVAVAEAVGGEAVEVRGLAEAAEGADLSVADVVEDDEEDVGGAVFGADGLGPGGEGLFECATDDAFEGLGHGVGTSCWFVCDIIRCWVGWR